MMGGGDRERLTRFRYGVAVALIGLAGCSANVLHGIDERAANEATAALERVGIGAEKVPDDATSPGAAANFTVRVAAGDANRAVDLLHALGLPRERRRGFAETYGQPSLIPTPSEERARYVNATAGEIEKTLETIDGVIGARVHLVLEDADPLSLDTKPRARRPGRRAAESSARRRAHRRSATFRGWSPAASRGWSRRAWPSS